MIDYVGQVWYQIQIYELIDGYWHPKAGYSTGVGSWKEGERQHIFRAIGHSPDGTRTTYLRVYPKNSKEFSELIHYDSKIYKDGEGNIFFK